MRATSACHCKCRFILRRGKDKIVFVERRVRVLLMLFDYLVAMLVGCASALLAALVVPSGWPVLAGMLAGMILGMIVLVAAVIALGWIGGAFEIVMPGMFIVMSAGMVCGMAATSSDTTAVNMAAFGVATGLAIQFVFHLYDSSLHGEVFAGQTQNEAAGQ